MPPPAFSDTLLGRSGQLRARFVAPGAESAAARRAFALAFGTPFAAPSGERSAPVRAVAAEGEVTVQADRGASFSVIPLVPFTAKRGERLGTYRLGYWPAERGRALSAAYDNPAGFIRVTPENEDTPVSEHFRLRDFLTKDQAGVWPKYLVLREPLLDKLELVIRDLEDHGVPVTHLSVMSGFRAPEYNQLEVGPGGRAQNSRHQYGDAADVFVDNDRDGYTDDVNRDGRVDIRDAQVVAAAAERVEREYPELTGGIGIYRATGAHGPFTHIDARGHRARWNGA